MRFNYIQILRFFAAASVVLYHGHYYVGEWLWKTPLTRSIDYYFAWGVELFFAISGFVVSHSLSQFSPGRFLVLRLLRIYPAFWLAAAFAIAGQVAFGWQPLGDRLLLALTLLPVGGADYPLGGVEWSLVYEVFFYSMLAAFALIPARNAREMALFVWLFAIVAATWFAPSEATSFVPTFRTIAFSAFNLPFIAGALAYSWFRHAGRIPVVALIGIVPLALLNAHRALATEVQLAFQAVGFAALVLLAAELSRRRDASRANPLVRLGDWSYGLYLVHVPVIKAVLAMAAFTPSQADSAFVATVSTALIAGCGYGAVELGIYRHNKSTMIRHFK